LKPIIEKYLNRARTDREVTRGVWQVRSASAHVTAFLKGLGVRDVGEERRVPESVFQAPKEAVIGFIEGLFSSDGSVGQGDKSRHYIRLNSSSLALLKDVQILLLNFGVKSAIYDRSTKPKTFLYTNKDGIETRHTTSGTNYELNVSKESFALFARTFQFMQKRKDERMRKIAERHEFYHDYFIEKVAEITPRGKESVWDLTETKTHSFIANGFVIKNCGEVLLYPNESCNLGSVNAHAFVKRNGDRSAHFDWEGFKEAVMTGIEFLDNVIEVNNFPLPAIEEMTRNTRKVGLGVMGVADALFSLRIPYDSKEGMAFMERLMQFINYWSKIASIELANKRGPFPLYKETFFVEGKLPFAGSKDKRSWQFDWKEMTERIKKEGIRNSYTTVIAPTGSISMIAGTSSGIEPVFSLVYEKNVAVGNFYYIDSEFEIAMKEFGIYDEELLKTIVSHHGSLDGISYLPKEVKSVFRVAHDLTPESHIQALAIFQKWVDSSISKTINFSKHATVDDMKKAYLLAYKLGCKDVTVYRDSSIENQVLSTPGKKEEKGEEGGKAKAPVPEGNKPTHCPKCSTKLVRGEGCLKCPSCGWGLCT
ncbi:MAG: LAGLIDADG family homing endonuclease, partial [Patescibacteria group bacterium]